jgi:hypothetical protein
MRSWRMVCNVRRADSLPTPRAIDWEKAARWIPTKGVRRAAMARMYDMMAFEEVSFRDERFVVVDGLEGSFVGVWREEDSTL